MSSPVTGAAIFSFVAKALLVPLGTATAGVGAEILRGQLSKGRTEANLRRLEAIRTLLADDALGLPGSNRRALKEEVAIIAESRQVLQHPRNITGGLATGLCPLFLYIARVAGAIDAAKEESHRPQP